MAVGLVLLAWTTRAAAQVAPAAPETVAIGDWQLVPILETRVRGEYTFDLDSQSRGFLVERALKRRFASWGYAEREDDLLVRRGILVHRLSVVPYGRMQFIDVRAGPLERSFGLATVHMHTAAAASDARIPGLTENEAARLRDRLAELGEAQAAGL